MNSSVREIPKHELPMYLNDVEAARVQHALDKRHRKKLRMLKNGVLPMKKRHTKRSKSSAGTERLMP